MKYKLKNNEEEWKNKLTKEQFHILMEAGTEMPFTGEYVNNKSKGIYKCAACGFNLFSSDSKFDSGTGWPSFDKPLKNIETKEDRKLGIKRIEVKCPKCGGHLGHVFSDGPTKTKKRYCINSCSLKFKGK